MRISLDERLADEERRPLRAGEGEVDDDDDLEGEREPPVEIRDGAEESGEPRVGEMVLVVMISMGLGNSFCCCSKFFRSSDTLGYVNDSVSDGVRADMAETVVKELVVIVVDAWKA